ELAPLPAFRTDLGWFLEHRAEITKHCVATREHDGRPLHVLALMTEEQLRRLLGRVWDPAEFRSPHGVRSLSKYHESHPFVFGATALGYEPAEAVSRLKGGNSNWRGPVW